MQVADDLLLQVWRMAAATMPSFESEKEEEGVRMVFMVGVANALVLLREAETFCGPEGLNDMQNALGRQVQEFVKVDVVERTQ